MKLTYKKDATLEKIDNIFLMNIVHSKLRVGMLGAVLPAMK